MSEYGQGPSVPTAAAPEASRRASATPVLPIISFVLSAVALFFLPIVFGIAAIVLAAISLSRRERLAKVALAVAILATVIGMALGFLLAAGVQAG
jgi:hypothetical protein